ncbi:PAAR domain-containing protein [Marivita sp. S6314]|nr:PAAR domain-containing protein [Marivita sp. S6314]MCK0149287.1 PAAR domain-containing protein [Marivita sp. S6314]
MPILPPCCVTVLVGKLPAARAFMDLCTPAFPHPIVKGSTSVLITNVPAARVTDSVACGGVIVKGEPTVLVGG